MRLPEAEYFAIQEILRLRRNKNSMTLEKLAKKLDCSVNFLHQIEQGMKFPSVNMFFRWCKVLNYELQLIDKKEK